MALEVWSKIQFCNDIIVGNIANYVITTDKDKNAWFKGPSALIIDSQQGKEGEERRFALQIDTRNGAVTLRQTLGGENNEIYGGYITLFQPTGKGTSRTNLDNLFLTHYKTGNNEIGKALTDFEARLDAQGFNSAPVGVNNDWGTGKSNESLFYYTPYSSDSFADVFPKEFKGFWGAIHQSGAVTEFVVDREKTDLKPLFAIDGSSDYKYESKPMKFFSKELWRGDKKFPLNLPKAIKDNTKTSFDEVYYFIAKFGEENWFYTATIHYPNDLSKIEDYSFTISRAAAVSPFQVESSLSNAAIVWRTIY